MDGEMIKRKVINLLEYSPEILNFFNTNKYKKTKEGLRSAISDWLDGEFFTVSNNEQKTEFVDKYFNI